MTGPDRSWTARQGRQHERDDARITWPYPGVTGEAWLGFGMLAPVRTDAAGIAASSGPLAETPPQAPTTTGSGWSLAGSGWSAGTPAQSATSAPADAAGEPATYAAGPVEPPVPDQAAPFQSGPSSPGSAWLPDDGIGHPAAASQGVTTGNAARGAKQVAETPQRSSEDPQAGSEEIARALGDAEAGDAPFAAAASPAHQLNFSMSDHDADAVSTSSTLIGQIVSSIVFIGGNVAVANATNAAPVTQLNVAAGGGGAWPRPGEQDHQALNLAVTDNDARATAIAQTHIASAVDSIIIAVGTTAVASAVNHSPVTQVNHGRFASLDDQAFSATNALIADNDSLAFAEAGILVGSSIGSMVVAGRDLPDAGSGVAGLAAGVGDHPLWDEFLALQESLAA
jgi:hypothetical protein